MEELQVDELQQELSDRLIDLRCKEFRNDIKYEECKLLEDRCVKMFRELMVLLTKYTRLQQDYLDLAEDHKKLAIDAKQWQDGYEQIEAETAEIYRQTFGTELFPIDDDDEDADDFPTEELL